jgi:hypothetical protein
MTTPRTVAINQTLSANNQLAKLSQIGSGCGNKSKSRWLGRRRQNRGGKSQKSRRQRWNKFTRKIFRRQRQRHQQRGGASVPSLPNSELYNANASNAAITKIGGQSQANAQYDKVSLIQK